MIAMKEYCFCHWCHWKCIAPLHETNERTWLVYSLNEATEKYSAPGISPGTLLLLLLGPGLKGGQRHQVSSFVPNGKTDLERMKAQFENWAEERKLSKCQMEINPYLPLLGCSRAQLLCNTARVWPLLLQQLCTLYETSWSSREGWSTLNLWQGAWLWGELPAPLPFTAMFNGLALWWRF